MGILLTNALLCDIDPIGVQEGSLRIDGGRIAVRGEKVRAAADDEVIDCGGCVVLPGLVNGHTHLYSALAVGMPAPPRIPRNFVEILQLVWWRLDQALDEKTIETSARIGALEALRSGTTTLIDHHASPNEIAGSLDLMENGIGEVGLRGVLCYETTDRHGRKGREAGLAENRRYLRKCADSSQGRFAGLVGAHASFTLDDETLDALSGLAQELGSGVHIHVGEDPADEEACRREHRVGLVQRLEEHGLLKPASVFAHGTHLNGYAIQRVNEAHLHLAHNPRSNMNNAVGYSPVGQIQCPVMLGTDGIGADMFAEAQQAWFKSRDGGSGLSPGDVIGMLANSARRAGAALGVELGKLSEGAAADVVVTDYLPSTPLDADNLPGHFIFGLGLRHVKHVIAAGRWALRDREVQTCDEAKVRQESQMVARRLWDKLRG